MLTDRKRRRDTAVERCKQTSGPLCRTVSSLLHIFLTGVEVAESKVTGPLLSLLVYSPLAALDLLLGDGGDLRLIDDLVGLLIEVNGGADGRGNSGREGGEVGSLVPHELDELVLKVPTGRNDVVEIVCPHDQHTLVTLQAPKSNVNAWERHNIKYLRTMKAPHCSLSARGSQPMVSKIWIRVSSST